MVLLPTCTDKSPHSHHHHQLLQLRHVDSSSDKNYSTTKHRRMNQTRRKNHHLATTVMLAFVAVQRFTATALVTPSSPPAAIGQRISSVIRKVVSNSNHNHDDFMRLFATDSRELRFYAGGSSSTRSSSSHHGNHHMHHNNGDARSAILEPQLAIAAIMEPILAGIKAESEDPRATTKNNGASPSSLSSSSSLDGGLSSSFSTSTTNNGQVGSATTSTTGPPIFPNVKTNALVLSPEEQQLFKLLHQVTKETELSSTLRVAGGWVRDKLLATSEFQKNVDKVNKPERLTSKYRSGSSSSTTSSSSLDDSSSSSSSSTKKNQPSMGRQGTKVLMDKGNAPVDIDIALDDMLGREFADHLNEWLAEHGKETHSVGVVLKNPEKSKHLETATMKVGSFWIDFVNLRAEEYTQDSRIPDLMRIGTPDEDAFRRDLTINALFYNINNGQVEDWTGRGFEDLRRGIVATPLAPLTTLLDDPLRVLRSVRFAARLRFAMDDTLVEAAKDERVREALAQKVSRERVGGEVDLMLRSLDPVGAMRLLCNLNLVSTVFPLESCLPEALPSDHTADGGKIFSDGLTLLSTTHDHLCDCQLNPPIWCEAKRASKSLIFGVDETMLMENDEARRLLWYAAFLKPLLDYSKIRQSQISPLKSSKGQGRKANRSVIQKLLVDELKRPTRDADAVERIMKAADDFTRLINSGCDLSAMAILMSEVKVEYTGDGDNITFSCALDNQSVDSETETHPVWIHAMEFRLLCSKVLQRSNTLWRAALFLSLSEQLVSLDDEIDYAIEGDVVDEIHEEYRKGVLEKYNAFAAALQQMGLIGIWDQKPLIDGGEMKKILSNIPKGPVFREIMDEQDNWLTTHPGGRKEALAEHLKEVFPDFV
mmetsp:Transcript_26134/g.36839  ORF Transcript_26134/g.36839 Transcript_26134/m.36839 type:complete len:879 (-) Transcript_26134:78-2714(-)